MTATNTPDRATAELLRQWAGGDKDLRVQMRRQLAVLPVVAESTTTAAQVAIRQLQTDDTLPEAVLERLRSYDTWLASALRQVEQVANTLRVSRCWSEREYEQISGVPLACDRAPDLADVVGLQPEGLPA